MAARHFAEPFAERAKHILHDVLPSTNFYKTQIFEVPGVVTAVLLTYEGITDDSLEVHRPVSWDEFRSRLEKITPEWRSLERATVERMETGAGGWESRTIYFFRAGQNPEQWTAEKGQEAVVPLLLGSVATRSKVIRWELEHLAEIVPVGREHFAEFERIVRITFNFLFHPVLGEGRAQVRTEPENEGVEIRDLMFANNADSGFWKDLKDKYSVSEVVVDAKNTNALTRDDLRQLYCYLKPALGLWGFIVCRERPPSVINAFNRTLFKNFAQSRGVLILAEQDLIRMVTIAEHDRDPSDYLRERMSEFLRSI